MPTKKAKQTAAVVQAVKKIAEDDKSKKKKPAAKSGWKHLLGKAASMAVDLAPAVLPLLMAKHAPTAKALAGKESLISASGGSAALATGSGSVGNICGLRGIRTAGLTRAGSVHTIIVTTCDMIASVSPNGTAGDIAWQCMVSPLDPALQGSKFAGFARQFEKYSVRRGCFLVEPACAATVPGALTGAVFVDPLVQLDTISGFDRERTVASQDGAETFNIWEAGMFHVPKASGTPLFIDPNGADARLTMQGLATLVLAADCDGTGVANIYFLAETEYSVPSIVEPPGPGPSFAANDLQPLSETAISYSPLPGLDAAYAGSWQRADGCSPTFVDNTTYVDIGPLGGSSPTQVTGNGLRGLPAGGWVFMAKTIGTGLDGAVTPRMTAALENAGGRAGSTNEFGDLQIDTENAGLNRGVAIYTYWVPQMDPEVIQFGFSQDGSNPTWTSSSRAILFASLGRDNFTDGLPGFSSLLALTSQGKMRAQENRLAQLECSIALARKHNQHFTDSGSAPARPAKPQAEPEPAAAPVSSAPDASPVDHCSDCWWELRGDQKTLVRCLPCRQWIQRRDMMAGLVSGQKQD